MYAAGFDAASAKKALVSGDFVTCLYQKCGQSFKMPRGVQTNMIFRI